MVSKGLHPSLDPLGGTKFPSTLLEVLTTRPPSGLRSPDGENTNGLLRQGFPLSTDLYDLDRAGIADVHCALIRAIAAGSVLGTAGKNRSVIEWTLAVQWVACRDFAANKSSVMKFSCDRRREQCVGRCNSMVERQPMRLS
jgi:hypothetical protein